MLAVLVAYNIGTCTSTDQRCNSRAEEKAYRPLSPKSTIASKLKPWDISCVKGRQNKKLVRWMFCRMCRKVPEKNCIKEALQHSCSVLCQVVMCVSSALCVWQNVWKHHRSVRVVAFSLFWLLSGGDREYGCLSTACILCTLCNLHCTWCRMLSFVTCCLACPSHNVTVAACFAMFVPFAPRVVFPQLEIRSSGNKQKAGNCVRWRCRNRDMLSSHADLFKGHGMDPEADCHTLETKAMSAEECKRHKDEILAGIGRQEHFVDKYKVLWDGMKTLMTWNRMVIRIEATSDAGLGRATVCTRNAYIQNKMQKHGGTDAMKEGSQQKMFRSAAAVMGSLQTCVKKYNAELLQSYGPEEIGDCLCRLFEEIHRNRLMWQSQEASRKTLSFAAACRAVVLRQAQERQEPTSDLLRDFSIAHAMQDKQQRNTFTGLVNFRDRTCWLNSAVQLLWHGGFMSEWLYYSENVPRTPLVHELSNAPQSTSQVGVCFNASPRDISQNVLESSCTMQDYVDMQLQDCNVALDNESRQILVQTIPFVVNAVTGELFWMQNRIVDWDSEVDLSRLFRQSRSRYRVKAAILHIHNEDSPVSATSGHYVTAIKQNNAWHLANDEFVRVVRINECPLLPCGLLFEKCDDQCSQKTMLIEGRMCEELSWEHCICKEAECVPSAASTQTMMPNETAESLSWTQLPVGGAVCAQAGEIPDRNETAESLSWTQLPVGGAVCAQAGETPDRNETAESVAWTQLPVGGAVCTQERKGKKRNTSDGKGAQTLLKYFKTDRTQDRTERQQDRTKQSQDRTGRQQERTERSQERTERSQDRTERSQDRTERSQDRTERSQKQERTERAQDRTERKRDRTDEAQAVRARNVARERTQKCHVDPFMLDQTPLALFAKRYNLPVRKGLDNRLRVFSDSPDTMPPISCLLHGCEKCFFTNLSEFVAHCDAEHEGYHTYRLRVLHLMTQQVWQFPGSLQRAALQNFAEFQVRGATDWDGFTPAMNEKLSCGQGLQQHERWGPRRFLACVVCAERRWSEELIPTFIAGPNTAFQKEDKVRLLLDPNMYVATWPEVPSEEVFKSCPTVHLQTGEKVQMLLHKRRVSQKMCVGEEPAPLCKQCRKCLVKNPPEMPSRALANGKWLGRQPELMRRMPYGRRMLLPLRRVILTKVFFTSNSKNPWERSHAACGLDGVTTIVEQAPTLPTIKEYPPSDLSESFEAVFVGIDPQDLRKKQTFPISKTLLLKQFEFVQRNSKPHQEAVCRKADVEDWADGETPAVFQNTFVDAPVDELDAEEVEELGGAEDSNKYRGPVDSTLGAQELLESSEDVPVSYHCQDNVPLDKNTCWQVAAAKLAEMEKLAAAIQTEEELGEFVQDKPRRSVLIQTAAEFRKAVGQVSAAETRKNIEEAIRAEPIQELAPEFTAEEQPKLIVPTGTRYAKMWEPSFWQEWNPMDWCYGNCVYGDERLQNKPYKSTSFQEIVKHWLLREELEYDVYEGENYEADHGEPKVWEHATDVQFLLQQLEDAAERRQRARCRETTVPFAVNRFAINPVNIMVIATFWRMMSGFMAVNVGLRIPGIQTQLKSLAQLPDQLVMLSSREGEADGMMGLVRRASHLFNLVMGKVVGTNGYRIACRHKFTAYTIFLELHLYFAHLTLRTTETF